MNGLAHWPEGTVAVLSTIGEGPRAIPVSAAVRAGPSTVLLALGHRRGSLARLRDDPRVALVLLAPGLAITAHGQAAVAADPLPGAEHAVAVALTVDEIQDHDRPAFSIEDGVRWHWLDPEARDADARVRVALAELAKRRGGR